ncbi:replication protein A 70 kDa DNA-binding subunit D-like isoform X2 [Populus nigra]|uniref:replication protein A 70 kDa DNA-binding subunit D-like isoform X2 n=1 Tax=Populus nigra TaxID=3691 RepID=UPI002B27730D|nr:replication protein A 70 kDa DNA-binding subunit D-like isoform X2 [Populus nigra]
MAIHLQNIKKYVFYPLIRARVCRVWIPKQNGQATNFNCLFVNREGGTIQGSAKSRDVAHFSSIITEGDYYEVKNFYTFENRYMNIVVSHEAVIDLKSDTKVTHLNSLPLSIPRYYFNFMDFTHVLNKGKESRLLTDVLGRLKAIQPIEKILVRGQTLEDKREFILENIRGEELRITLWGDIARSFDEASLAEQDSPVIVAFAGFRVSEFSGSANLIGTAASLWYFNPDIPELLAYKHYYAQIPVDIHQLPPSSRAILSLETQINESRRTIREILCMDPFEHKNERFTCKAFIVDYDLFKGWWCESCPDCNKPLSGLPNNLRCMEHDYPTSTPVPWFRINCIVRDGQDVTNFLLSGKTVEYFFNASAHHLVFDKKFTDPFIVPPQMIEKLNKTKIFQLRFGAYKSVLSRCEIYVCNIFDDIATEAYINPASPIKVADATGPIATGVGSSIPFTSPTPNLTDPLSVDQSQKHTSPQKDTFHDSCHRQSKRALIFNDSGPHDSTQLPQPRPLKDYADSSKEHLCEDDDTPGPGLSKKQHLSISSTEKEKN